jgi:segregation and condensation protein A
VSLPADSDRPPIFEEDGAAPPGEAEAFQLALEGYEGPIDVLLQLAREQKVDITRISILALADQYLIFIQNLKRLRLEVAADYLVMAAWLAYLKSRLLIPEPETIDGEPSGAEMAAALAFQLQRLQAMRDAGQRLMQRPRLGLDVFARGEPQRVVVNTTTVYELSLYDLLKAYGEIRGRQAQPMLRIPPMELYSVEDAIARLLRMLGELPGWRSLTAFLPHDAVQGGIRWRSALASTFAASLEMVRQGKARLRQDGNFGPIYLQGVREGS